MPSESSSVDAVWTKSGVHILLGQFSEGACRGRGMNGVTSCTYVSMLAIHNIRLIDPRKPTVGV